MIQKLQKKEHNEIIKNQFNRDIIANFKTYNYLEEKRSKRFGDYFEPRKKILCSTNDKSFSNPKRQE